MKKRLLLSLALAVGTFSAYAFNVGEYVFTPTQRLKISGENILTNGTFTSGTSSWTGKDGTGEVNAECWAVADAQGPNKENALQSLDAGAAKDNYAYNVVPLTAGRVYVVALQVKGVSNTSSSTTADDKNTNYIDAFVNTDGSVSKTSARQIFTATDNPITTDWTTISDTIQCNKDGEYLIVGVGRLDAGTLVTNFTVQEASVVYDTRIAARRIAYDRKLLAIPEFTEGAEDFKAFVDEFEAAMNKGGSDNSLGVDFDDESSVTSFMEGEGNPYSEYENTFLNANSYDLIDGDVIADGNIFTATNSKYSKLGGQHGDWFLNSTYNNRWERGKNSDVLSAYMSGKNRAAMFGQAEIHKRLPAGKYLFQIDANGFAYVRNSASAINPTPVKNRLYFGTDSTEWENLDKSNYVTYVQVADVPASPDETTPNLVAGSRFESVMGGTVRYHNPHLRIISKTGEADIIKFTLEPEKDTQLNAAKVMIDSANVVVESKDYPWGKQALRDAIAQRTATYNALQGTDVIVTDPETNKIVENKLTVLDGDGNPIYDDAGYEKTKNVPDSLMSVMRYMRTDIQTYYAENKPYTDLVAQIAESQSILNNADYAKATAATRTALQNEIEVANGIVKGWAAVADSVEGDAAKSAAEIDALQTAAENFMASTASYANPTEIYINNPLTEGAQRNQVISTLTNLGWDFTGSQTDNGGWKQNDNAAFEGGHYFVVGRGEAYWGKNKAVQKVTLNHKGAYEFRVQAFSYNNDANRDGGVTKDHQVYYFAKEVNSADSIGSISLHTLVGTSTGTWNQTPVDSLGYGAGVPEYFVITYNKTTEGPTEIEFGINAMNNGANGTYGANHYAFGGNHVRYFGDYAAYTAAAQSTLKAELAQAQATLAANAGAKDSAEYKALENAVLAAQSAIDGTTLAFPVSATSKAPYMMTYVGWVDPNAEQATEAKRFAQTNSASDKKAALETKALLTLQRAETAFHGVVTGIKGISIAEDAEEAAVKANAKGVFNIAGQKVAENAKNLPAGLYIINGKKVVVK